VIDSALYHRIRAATCDLCRPLAVEDYVVQTMPDASPTKWHLAHTTWFFETFVLARVPGYRPLDPRYHALFNSYYQSLGPPPPRMRRGTRSRPTVDEVYDYRRHVDAALQQCLERGEIAGELAAALELGLHHEEQHQELILTDAKTLFCDDPLAPIFRPRPSRAATPPVPLRWFSHPGGLLAIGHDGDAFAFDNERPRHRVHLEPFSLASRLVTVGEYRAFVEAGGYSNPSLWLSDGWDLLRAEGWEAPLYWFREGGEWHQATLAGRGPLSDDEPVCHVSFYEADAYARFHGARLPRETEWEAFAARAQPDGHFLDGGDLHPRPARDGDGPVQLFGDTWEWTASPYGPYPGYVPFGGALGEYNGKFMCNQMVLRGGSCATPRRHIRASYRNFFPPGARWQFTGIRLAK
jgi:ergothioneine biosynthesis protein EgtB